jgi:hypothetical protein
MFLPTMLGRRECGLRAGSSLFKAVGRIDEPRG